MSYLLYAVSSFVLLLLYLKLDGAVPSEEAFLILAILSAAEAVGFRINR